MKDEILFEFECAECGLIDSINWEPKNPDALLCEACHRKRGDSPRYDMSKVSKSPRREHNTKVAFPIECCVCGTKETLDHIPKGVPMNAIKCTSCLEKALRPDSKHAQVAEIKDGEKGITDYDIVCDVCGVDATIPFRPKPGRRYLCKSCQDAENAGFVPRSEIATAGSSAPEVSAEEEEPAPTEKIVVSDTVFRRKKIDPETDLETVTDTSIETDASADTDTSNTADG